jgi:hypothetical protein
VHLGQLGVERVVIVVPLDFPREKTCGSVVSPKRCAVLNGFGVSEAVGRESYTISGLRLVNLIGSVTLDSFGTGIPTDNSTCDLHCGPTAKGQLFFRSANGRSWPITAAAVGDCRGSFWGYNGHDCPKRARQFMTEPV